MDVRPVFWVVCGAGATLLTSAWGSKVVTLPLQNQNQNANVASAIVQTNSGVKQEDEKNNLLIKRQPWAEPKSDPFSKASFSKRNVVASVAVKLASNQTAFFPYVFIGRLISDEKNAVFLSRNNQIYCVVEGDTLEDVYRIERLGSDTLEITYLPEQRKITFTFDTLAEKITPQAVAALSHADVLPTQPTQVYVLPDGMAEGGTPSVDNGQMTEDIKQTLAPSPAEGDILKMMGVPTQQTQGDALQMMAVLPAQGVQATLEVPTASAAPAVSLQMER